jgi:hypothetical protein
VLFDDEAAERLLLLRGLYDADGVCHREAFLRPFTGREEAALWAVSPAAASVFLAGCLDRIGGYGAIEPEHAAALSRGDRQHLALHVRRGLFGDRISLVVPCPNPSCGKLADLDLRVSDIAPAPSTAQPEVLEAQTPDGPARLREPTGADDDWIAQASGDRRARSALLWSRLVLDLGGKGPLAPDGWWALSAATRAALALALADQAAAPDLSFLSHCPSCRALLELELDPMDLLCREMRFGGERLVAELHCLAWYYHWSEADILALPRARRWRYLELLTRQVEGRPLLDVWGPSAMGPQAAPNPGPRRVPS